MNYKENIYSEKPSEYYYRLHLRHDETGRAAVSVANDEGHIPEVMAWQLDEGYVITGIERIELKH